MLTGRGSCLTSAALQAALLINSAVAASSAVRSVPKSVSRAPSLTLAAVLPSAMASSEAATRERTLPGNSPAEGANREDMDDQARSDFLSRRGYRAGDKVLLYDGVCNLCNGWVNFVMDKDPQARYKFASLQGEAGRALMTRVGRNPDDLSTLVLIECGSQLPLVVGTGPLAEEVRSKLRAQRAPEETVYIKSEAVLRVVEDVGGRVLGTAAYVARTMIPRSVRDFIYSNCVAPNRYLVFGKSDNCRRVTAALRPRFLDLDQGSHSAEDLVIDLRGR